MRRQSGPNRKTKFGIIIWAALFSFILANMILSPKLQNERILATGQVYEFRQDMLEKSNSTWVYDAEQKIYTITSQKALKRYTKFDEMVDWKCLYIKLDKLSAEQVDWVFKAYDGEKNLIGQQIITLQNGENWIAIQAGNPFQRFHIQILGAEGLQFQIKEMRLYEEIPQKKKVLLLSFAICVFVLGCLLFLKRKWINLGLEEKLNAVWGFFHTCYMLAGNIKRTAKDNIYVRKNKNRTRTGLFLFLFIYMLVVYNQNVYQSSMYFRYHSLIFALVILIIAFISKEKELLGCVWNTKIAYYWLAFWMFVCMSDFVVTKRFRFVGWVMLFLVGFLIKIWQNMKHPYDLIRNILYAIEILAVGGMIYNMLFRVKYDGLLYNGYMRTATDFGIYSAFLCLVFLVEMYGCWKKQDFGKKMVFSVCGEGISLLQVLLSGKLSALVNVTILILIAVLGMFRGFFRLSKAAKMKMVIYILIAGGIVCAYYFAIKKVPVKMHTEVHFVSEKYETYKEPDVIAVLAASGNDVYQNVKYKDADRQKDVWKAYLREMNLFGHRVPKLSVWGYSQPAQNLFLQILYRYGIFALVCYVSLFGMAIKEAVWKLRRTWGRWKKIDLLTAGVLCYWWTAGLFGDLEMPYYQPAWLLVYLLLGRYMTERKMKINGM